ncbi:MAG: M14 family zinc carboxypeptidase [Desulfosarcinaceae bacterium]|nr:M14 family zinc carboxypeptidase [Desulfosarcinaceae bacterium]
MLAYSRRTHHYWPLAVFICLLCLLGTTSPGAADPEPPDKFWWKVTPEAEVPSPGYDSLLYSEIAPKLREIQLNGQQRIHVKVMGKSAGGRNLFLVTVAAKGTDGRFGHYKELRRLMISDPDKALRKIEQYDDFKVPVFLNGSIHGDEYPGTDACIRLIEQLATENSPEVQAVLDNIILLINVVQNPDGRVLGTRENGNGFDMNRDMITQSQPETRATVKVINEWNPMVFLDLHGFIDPMLIEPCTPPHNPNYEYDLYLNSALQLAYAMRDELFARTDETEVYIPYVDWSDGWDDWAPIYAAMYPMLHGSYGHTLETPSDDEAGVAAHLAVVWGALNHVVANKKAMIRDQIEIYRRGALDLPQVLIPEALLAETEHDQYNNLTITEFPTAYIIPAKAPLQKNPLQAAHFVDFLLYNGVEVDIARRGFETGGVHYPRGTYLVWMDQPKRSLANTLLEDGMDVSALTEITFYSPPAAWSHPLLWGVSRTAVTDALAVATKALKRAQYPKGSLEGGWAGAYAFVADTLEAFQAVNWLLNKRVPVYWATEAFTDGGRDFDAGTVIVPYRHRKVRAIQKLYRLDIAALKRLPQEVIRLRRQKIAVYGEYGLPHALKEMGFPFEELSADDLNNGIDLSVYDTFIFGNDRWWTYNLTDAGIDAIAAYIDNGGDFIALGNGGNALTEELGLLDLAFDSLAGNGIANVDLAQGHRLTSGFQRDDHVFIYNPYWYPSVGAAFEVLASLDGDTMLVSGYVPEWQDSPAAGQPIMVFGDNVDDAQQDIVLMGFDPAFRGHPRNSFKLIGNAIFSGLD